MPDLLPVEGIEVKREGTYNVDPSPATSDGVRLARNVWSSMIVDYQFPNRRTGVVNGSIIPAKNALPRGRFVKLDLYVEIKGAGADVPPEVAELDVATGMPETDGSALWTYGPLTSSTKGSCTIYVYSGAKLFKITGCRGRGSLELLAGQLAVKHYTMWGILATAPTQTALAGITYDATEPIAAVNATFTIGGVSFDWLSLSIDPHGKDCDAFLSGSAVDGIQSFDFMDSDPVVEATLRSLSLATYDVYALKNAETTQTMVLTLGPAVAFNRLKILSASVSLLDHNHADSEGATNWRLRWQLESGMTWQFD